MSGLASWAYPHFGLVRGTPLPGREVDTDDWCQYPIEMVKGMPVVVAPQEIDASNADWLRAVLLEAAARGHAPSWSI